MPLLALRSGYNRVVEYGYFKRGSVAVSSLHNFAANVYQPLRMVWLARGGGTQAEPDPLARL